MNEKMSYLYVFLCGLFFTLYYFFYKIALQYISNINLIALQYFIMSILLFIVFIIFRRKEFVKEVNRTSILYAFLIGIFSILSGMTLYILLKTESYTKIIAIIEPLIVVISFIIGIFYFKHKVSIKSIIGLILSIVGVCLLSL
jgi:uncharacterized membrane protein